MRLWMLIPAIFLSTTAYSITDEYIRSSIERAAEKVGVPVDLLSAICFAESEHNPAAFVYADGGQGNHAFGLCQILRRTAEDFGFKDDGCDDDYRYRKSDRTYKECGLFGPYTNAYYAAKYLKYQLDRYGGSWINAVAAYNSGTVRLCRTGWVKNVRGETLYRCEKGGLLNQRYVDRVLKALNEGDCYGECSKHREVQGAKGKAVSERKARQDQESESGVDDSSGKSKTVVRKDKSVDG